MTGNAPRDTPIIGSLHSEGGKGVVRLHQRYDSEVTELWSSLTDPSRLAGWHARVDGDLRPGGTFHLYVQADDWEGTGRVEACEPGRSFLVTTRESDESWKKGQGVPPYDETIEATLAAAGGHTDLVLEIRGIPLDAVAFYGVGWQIHVENLAAYLAGRERDDSQTRWQELLPAYQSLAAALE